MTAMTEVMNEYSPLGEDNGDIDSVNIELKILAISGQFHHFAVKHGCDF